ncbi:MAG: CHAT domain-containing protein [Gammaproteobacteria bacterium]|nr:CHAT domain-containing protein [Gammaproteobacteria bacterium]
MLLASHIQPKCAEQVLMLIRLSLIFAILCVHLTGCVASDSQFEFSTLHHENEEIDGFAALQRGELLPSKHLKQYKTSGSVESQLTTLVDLSDAYRANGDLDKSITTLQKALELIEQFELNDKTGIVLSQIVNAYMQKSDYSKATDYLYKTLHHTETIKSPSLKASILNNLGIIHMETSCPAKAREEFITSVELAEQTDNFHVASQSHSNLAKLNLLNETNHKTGKHIDSALKHIKKTTDTYHKAMQLLRVGRLAQTLSETADRDVPRWRTMSYQSYKYAEKISKKHKDYRLQSYAKGYMGQLYLKENRISEGLQLTNQAITLLDNIHAPDIRYQWYWQKGRIFNNTGQLQKAIAAYQEAASILQQIRQSFSSQNHPRQQFERKIERFYLELADLLLRSSETTNDEEKIQEKYRLARDTIEQLKVVQLENYLKDDCVTRLQASEIPIEEISEHTAIIYPILLQDRTEILVSVNKIIKRYKILVNKEKFSGEVQNFRLTLENKTTREYLPHAQSLYNWLIKPIEEDLKENNIDTLVIVPDGPLLTIPMAALHNGHNFLIEEFAIATTPGMKILKPKSMDKTKIRVLAAGLSGSIKDSPALPYVPLEISYLRDHFITRDLQDESFTFQTLKKEFSKSYYSILHLGTHSTFDNYTNTSFIMGFDGKISSDQLQQMEFN